MSINPEEFLNESYEHATSTQLKPIPPGEYQALLSDLELRSFERKTGELAGTTGYRMMVKWEIQDPQLEQELGRTPVVFQNIFLDFTPEGALDFSEGQNIQLGRLREALGQNIEGQPWRPAQMKGQVAIIQVQQEMDGDNIRTNVSRVAAA